MLLMLHVDDLQLNPWCPRLKIVKEAQRVAFINSSLEARASPHLGLHLVAVLPSVVLPCRLRFRRG